MNRDAMKATMAALLATAGAWACSSESTEGVFVQTSGGGGATTTAAGGAGVGGNGTGGEGVGGDGTGGGSGGATTTSSSTSSSTTTTTTTGAGGKHGNGGAGGGGQGPTPCTIDEDCKAPGACSPDAVLGCGCKVNPQGEGKCAPLCKTDADCPKDPNKIITCDPKGFCSPPKPDGGPGGQGPGPGGAGQGGAGGAGGDAGGP